MKFFLSIFLLSAPLVAGQFFPDAHEFSKRHCREMGCTIQEFNQINRLFDRFVEVQKPQGTMAVLANVEAGKFVQFLESLDACPSINPQTRSRLAGYFQRVSSDSLQHSLGRMNAGEGFYNAEELLAPDAFGRQNFSYTLEDFDGVNALLKTLFDQGVDVDHGSLEAALGACGLPVDKVDDLVLQVFGSEEHLRHAG